MYVSIGSVNTSSTSATMQNAKDLCSTDQYQAGIKLRNVLPTFPVIFPIKIVVVAKFHYICIPWGGVGEEEEERCR